MRWLLALVLLGTASALAQLPENAIYKLGGYPFQAMRPINNTAMSPDGKLVAGSSSDRITIWEVATGKTVRVIDRIRSHENDIRPTLAFSPDSTTLAAMPLGASIDLYQVATGEKVAEFRDAEGKADFSRCNFSADGKSLIGSGFGVVFIWNVATQQRNSRIDIEGYPPIIPSRDGKKALVLKKPNRIEIVSLLEEQKTVQIEFKPPTVFKAWFDPTGKFVLVSCHFNEAPSPEKRREGFHPVLVYDAKTGTLIREVVVPHSWSANEATVSPDGKKLVATAFLGIYAWDLETGKLLSQNNEFIASCNQIHVLPDNDTLLIATENRLARSSISKGRIDEEKGKWQSYLTSRLSPDGKLLAFSDGFGKLELWNADTGKKQLELSNGRRPNRIPKSDYREPYPAIAFSSDGTRLVGRPIGMQIEHWNTTTGEFGGKHEFQPYPWSITSVYQCLGTSVYHPTEDRFVTVHPMDSIRLFSMDSKKQIWKGQVTKEYTSTCWTPDGKSILLLDRDRSSSTTTLTWIDPENGKAVGSLDLDVSVTHAKANQNRWVLGRGDMSLSVSRDGKLLALTVGDDTIRLVDLQRRKQIDRIATRNNVYLNSLAFSPDGRWLVFGGDLGKVKLFEVASRQEAFTFEGHQAPVLNVGFFPDGKRIYSSGLDCACIVWNALGTGKEKPLAELWDDLRKDAPVAFRARASLLKQEKETLAWIEKQIPPFVEIDAVKLAKLFVDLDSDEFTRREKADRELATLAPRIVAQLLAESKKENSAGKADRLKKLLDRTDPHRPLKDDELFRHRVREILSRFDSKEARELDVKLFGKSNP